MINAARHYDIITGFDHEMTVLSVEKFVSFRPLFLPVHCALFLSLVITITGLLNVLRPFQERLLQDFPLKHPAYFSMGYTSFFKIRKCFLVVFEHGTSRTNM